MKKIFGCSGWNCPVFCRCRLRAVSWRLGIMKLICSSVFALEPRFSDCSYAARNDAFAIRFASFFGPRLDQVGHELLRYMVRRFVAASPTPSSVDPERLHRSAFAIASKRYLRRRRGRVRGPRAECAPRKCAAGIARAKELRGARDDRG